MHRSNAAKTNGASSISYLVMYVFSFENRFRLVLVVFPLQMFFKILLVFQVGFMVSYIHLECAPY